MTALDLCNSVLVLREHRNSLQDGMRWLQKHGWALLGVRYHEIHEKYMARYTRLMKAEERLAERLYKMPVK